jgi:hypothetical protein
MTFIDWEREVNALMVKEHGVGIDDIPDMPYNDWYKAGDTVEVAVLSAIATVNEGGF